MHKRIIIQRIFAAKRVNRRWIDAEATNLEKGRPSKGMIDSSSGSSPASQTVRTSLKTNINTGEKLRIRKFEDKNAHVADSCCLFTRVPNALFASSTVPPSQWLRHRSNKSD